MKPKELADKLVDIVAMNSESSVMWRRSELTEDETLSIFAKLEGFTRAEFKKWKARRAEQPPPEAT